MAHCNHGCRWSRLNLVDLAPTVVDEIVIPLHYALEFLHVFAVLATPLHHALELGHGRHLHLGDERPVPVGADVGHDTHLRHADLGAQFRHREELLDQGPYTFPGLQYMISRMRSMRVLPCVGWVQAAAGRLTHRGEAAPPAFAGGTT